MESILSRLLLCFSLLLWGGYLVGIFFLQVHSNYEKRMFKRIVKGTLSDITDNKSKILKLNELTHILLGPPRKGLLLPSEEEKGFVDKKLNSSIIALIGGYACYMHSQVLGSMLKAAGFKYRNFSMWNNGKNHNVVEVLLDGKWVVLDPLFNQSFVNPNGDLVGKDVVYQNWDTYKKQIGNSCLFCEEEYRYDMDHNYTPSRIRSIGMIYKIRNAILLIWSKLLKYDSSEELIIETQLNAYLRWELLFSTALILWHFVLLSFYFIFYFYTGEQI